MSNLKVKIQKTELALELEKHYEISWDLISQFPYDAGFDLRASLRETLILLPTGHITIPTGLHVEFGDPNWEMQIRPRSGLAAKHGVNVLNAPVTVDYGDRKEVQVILYNCDIYENFVIKPGDRIAQACFREIPQVDFSYVSKISETINLEPALYEGGKSLVEEMKAKLLQKRGGFGSTGSQ